MAELEENHVDDADSDKAEEKPAEPKQKEALKEAAFRTTDMNDWQASWNPEHGYFIGD